MPGLDKEMGQLLSYQHLCNYPKFAGTWNQSFNNEMGQLCQGIGIGKYGQGKRVDSMETFVVIHYDDIHAN